MSVASIGLDEGTPVGKLDGNREGLLEGNKVGDVVDCLRVGVLDGSCDEKIVGREVGNVEVSLVEASSAVFTGGDEDFETEIVG